MDKFLYRNGIAYKTFKHPRCFGEQSFISQGPVATPGLCKASSKTSKPYTLGAETFANFDQIREKFYIDRFAKVYARENFQFFLFYSKLVGCP